MNGARYKVARGEGVISRVKSESQDPPRNIGALGGGDLAEGRRRPSCSPALKGELSIAELLELEEFGFN